MSEPVVLTPEMKEGYQKVQEYLSKGFSKLNFNEWYKLVTIFNAHFAEPFKLKKESPQCRPCVARVFDFFHRLKVTS